MATASPVQPAPTPPTRHTSVSSIDVAMGYDVVRAVDYEQIRDNKYLRNWPGYIADLATSGHVCDAALYDLRGGRLATSCDAFGLSFEEFSAVMYGFIDMCALRENGVSVAGKRYNVCSADGRRGIMGRVGLPAEGCSLCKTNELLIVATHSDTMKGKLCNQAVMDMGDFFHKKNL